MLGGTCLVRHSLNILFLADQTMPNFVTVRAEVRVLSKNKPARYEIMWVREKTLPNVIQEAWLHTSRGGNLGQIVLSLKNVMGKLQRWSRDKFGSVNKELGTLRKKLEDECIKGDLADQKFLRHLTECMDELLYREEMTWLPRSRVSWLQEGDRNTNFFHRKAVWRARKNKIKKISNGLMGVTAQIRGRWVSSPLVSSLICTLHIRIVILISYGT